MPSGYGACFGSRISEVRVLSPRNGKRPGSCRSFVIYWVLVRTRSHALGGRMRPKRGRPGKETFLWSLEGRVLSPRKAARRASPFAKAGEGEPSRKSRRRASPLTNLTKPTKLTNLTRPTNLTRLTKPTNLTKTFQLVLMLSTSPPDNRRMHRTQDPRPEVRGDQACISLPGWFRPCG